MLADSMFIFFVLPENKHPFKRKPLERRSFHKRSVLPVGEPHVDMRTPHQEVN